MDDVDIYGWWAVHFFVFSKQKKVIPFRSF